MRIRSALLALLVVPAVGAGNAAPTDDPAATVVPGATVAAQATATPKAKVQT